MSTARSIGHRSDFEGPDGEDDYDHISSSYTPDPEQAEIDAHLASYVSEQLQRVRSNQSADYVTGDEFEAHLDE